MGGFSGPKSSSSGLVFAYDMSSRNKSYIGKPTTNYLSNPTQTFNSNEFQQYYDLCSIFETYGLVPYSLSFDMRANKAGGVYWYMQNGSYTKYQFVSISLNATTEWQKFKIENATPYGPDPSWQAYTPSDNRAILATYTGYGSGVYPQVKNMQLELGAFSTPFVVGTRSNTQSLYDVIYNQSITLNSLTYSSEDTFAFNGSSSHITVPASSNWAFGQNGTIEQWVYIAGNSGTNNRLWCTVNNSSGIDAYLNGGTYNLYLHGGGVGTTSTLPTNQWVHLVVTYNSGTIAVYFNGVSQSLTGTTTGYNITNAGTLFIGQFSGGGNYYFNGRIPVTKIYNRGFTANEVSENFNALRSRYGI